MKNSQETKKLWTKMVLGLKKRGVNHEVIHSQAPSGRLSSVTEDNTLEN